MPKHKNLESDSDSDSGPEDRTPVKKAKTSSGGGSSSGGSRNLPKKSDDGELYWEVGSRRRITVRQFKGSTYIDIREYYEKDGQKLPGKKGISLKPGEWGLIKDLIEDVDEAIKNM